MKEGGGHGGRGGDRQGASRIQRELIPTDDIEIYASVPLTEFSCDGHRLLQESVGDHAYEPVVLLTADLEPLTVMPTKTLRNEIPSTTNWWISE